MVKKSLLSLLILLQWQGLGVIYAQQPSSEYIKTMNSYLPTSPEAAQMMKVADFPISYFTGTANINIPIFTVPGIGISVPISLSYTAGSGVRVDDQATNVGLSWSLNAGGEISREVRGNPDDGAANLVGLFNNPHPLSYYVNSYWLTSGSYTDFQLWASANIGYADLEPDIYYFSFCGTSGKFLYDDSLGKFICFDNSKDVKISFNSSLKTWEIINDDGSTYSFTAKENSASSITTYSGTPSVSPVGNPSITSWKLTKIVNADRTDSILINYNNEVYSYVSPGANAAYTPLITSVPDGRSAFVTYSTNTITGNTSLSSIVGRNFSVDFEYATADRLDQPGTHALSKIVVKNKDNSINNNFLLHQSYFNRGSYIGTYPLINAFQYSLKLDSISECGVDPNNTNPQRHKFSYDPTQLPSRLSFEKDIWGYANTNQFTAHLAPELYYEVLNKTLAGADRHSNLGRQTAGIITGVKYPTGATSTFEYEPNTTTIPPFLASPLPGEYVTVMPQIVEWRLPGELFTDSTTTFIINEGSNGDITGGGGVFATISSSSLGLSATPTSIDMNYPRFQLHKTAEVDGSPVLAGSLDAFHLDFQFPNNYHLFLPNGRYTMSMQVNNYNQNLPTPNPNDGSNFGTGLYFNISYKALDPNKTFHNFYLAGVRLKKITTTDQYTNLVKTRRFYYQDPVTDSSWGRYIGTTKSIYEETGGGTSAGAAHNYVVRMGYNNMPGLNNINFVVYPKVVEEVSDGGHLFRTEHYFSNLTIFPLHETYWPFVPAADIAVSRGNEILTKSLKETSAGFQNAMDVYKVFNHEPSRYLAPNEPFARKITGVKMASSVFDQAINTGEYTPTHIRPYDIWINRLYMTSDSTITYDLNNSSRSTTVWHDYTYGDNNMQPIVTRTGNSDGTVSTQKIWYPMDSPEPNSFINATLAAQMSLANRITQPLGTASYKDGTLLSQQYTYGHMDGSKLLTDSMTQAILNNAPETEIKVLTYDDYANPLTILLRGSKYRKYIWNKEKGLPLATAVMGTNSFFYFNSFEYGDGTAGAAFSGTKAYPLNSGALNFLSANLTAETDVYVWANSAAVYINGSAASSTGKTKGSWTLYTGHLSAGTSLSSISGSALIDQLIVLPSGSQFQGNVYDASGRVIAIANDQMSTAFFEYDHFGRLTSVRDEQGNIVKSSTYQIQGAQ